MSLSNSERQEFEQIVRSALEPALHELESRISAGFAEACDMWANLIADIQLMQAESAMKMREEDRKVYFQKLEERDKRRVEREERRVSSRPKVGGFTK